MSKLHTGIYRYVPVYTITSQVVRIPDGYYYDTIQVIRYYDRHGGSVILCHNGKQLESRVPYCPYHTIMTLL